MYLFIKFLVFSSLFVYLSAKALTTQATDEIIVDGNLNKTNELTTNTPEITTGKSMQDLPIEKSSLNDSDEKMKILINESKNETIETTVKPENVETTTKIMNSKCLKGEQLKNIVKQVIEKIPTHIKLPRTEKGEQIPLIMENGFINIDTKLMNGEPTCNEEPEGLQLYDIFVELKNLNGKFDWRLFNLFNHNFTEAVLMSLDKLQIEITVQELNTTSGNKIKVESVTLGDLTKFQAKVNMPEKVAEIKVENQDIDYVKSRITTFVEVRVKDVIDNELSNSLKNAINDAFEGKMFIDENLSSNNASKKIEMISGLNMSEPITQSSLLTNETSTIMKQLIDVKTDNKPVQNASFTTEIPLTSTKSI